MQRTEAGGLSVKQTGSRRSQALGADLIAGAGHSLSCTTHLWRVDVSVEYVLRETVTPASVTPETLFCALMPVYSMPAGCVRRHAS